MLYLRGKYGRVDQTHVGGGCLRRGEVGGREVLREGGEEEVVMVVGVVEEETMAAAVRLTRE